MPAKAWKAFERALGHDGGTERVPVNGRHAGDGDFETALFVFQAKHRRNEFPVTIARWLERVQAAAAARDPAKIGVVVIQRPRGRRSEALVVLSWKDWLDLHWGRPLELPPARGPPPHAGILFRLSPC